MRNLAEYVLRGRKQAILVALLFSVLPFLGWVADAIMALVTLRKGPKEGALVLVCILIPSAIIALAGYPQIWVFSILGGTLTTYSLALTLRHYGSWGAVLQIAMLLGVVAVCIVHATVPDIGDIWAKEINNYVQNLKGFDNEGMQKGLQFIARIGTGLQVTLLLLGDIFTLLMARLAQAMLYNPQGLRQELCNIRLGTLGAGLFILVLLGSIAGVDAAIDSLPVVILPFGLAGMSLVHSFIITQKNSKFWLCMFYGLLLLLFLYVIGILVILALCDSWWNLRRFFSKVYNSN